MKNKVELKNGVTLEVGKKYFLSGDDDVETILFLDEKTFYSEDEDGVRNQWILENQIDRNWLPYEEEETEKYCKILIERTDGALTSFEECFIKEKELIHLVDRVFNYVGYDLLKEYSSKEEMIKDLKK